SRSTGPPARPRPHPRSAAVECLSARHVGQRQDDRQSHQTSAPQVPGRRPVLRRDRIRLPRGVPAADRSVVSRLHPLTTRIGRIPSRIAARVLLFNLLLVFLPVAGLLYLDTYERHLLEQQERAMVDAGRILAATLAGEPLTPERAAAITTRL